jgi:prepilin signal peptidase PulO-like enzyme (type II secretory pathway)
MDFVLPLVFVPGLALGSFLGVVAARVPLRRSIVRPGSACMSCEAPLRWYDNVPVFSYALLRGRCRRCGVRIPPRDLGIELATSLLLVGCVLAFGFTVRAAAAAVACGALVVVTATDLERRIVPNRVVLPAAAAVLVLDDGQHPSPEGRPQSEPPGSCSSRRSPIQVAWGWDVGSPSRSARFSA